MHQSRPHDPGYGPISSLCKKLGYGAETKTDPRYYTKLSKPTAAFRKEYLKHLSLQDFPFEHYAPQARQCAGDFLRKCPQFFPSDTDAVNNRWPTYPRDADEIHRNLTKLMCAQEYSHQCNAIWKHNHEINEQILSSETTEDNDAPIDASELPFHHHGPVLVPQRKAAKLASAAINAVGETEGEYMLTLASEGEEFTSSETAREKIDEHLNSVYPLDGTPDGVEFEWLFVRSAAWPEDLKPFAWRYLHERNLYDFGKGSAVEIRQFITALKAKLNFTHNCTDEEDDRIFTKVSNFARNQVSRCKVKRNRFFESYGLLIENVVSGAIHKSPVFESSWSERRKAWIAKVHNNVIDDVIELRLNPPSPNTEIQVTHPKRPLCHDSDANHPADFESSFTAAKRQRRGEGPNLPPCEVPISLNHNMPSATITASTSPNAPQRVPEAFMTSNLGSESDKPEVIPTPKFLSPGRRDSHEGATSPQLSNKSPSSCDHHKSPEFSGEAEASTTPVVFERERATYTISGPALPCSDKFEESPTPQPVQINTPASTPANDDEKKTMPSSRQSWVQFFVETSPGALSHDAILLNDFKNAKLSDFLDLAHRRRPSPAARILKLTFIEDWQPHTIYQVDTSSTEIVWQEMKSKLRNDCRFRRTSVPAGEVLRVWVKCEAENIITLDDDEW